MYIKFCCRGGYQPPAKKDAFMPLPIRKKNRLAEFNYSVPGYYFLTICTVNKRKLLWDTEELIDGKPKLSSAGTIARKYLLEIPNHYQGVLVDKSVVMPNHIHLILELSEFHRKIKRPSVEVIIGQYKRAVSKAIGESIWQKGFHDHVIRGESDYRKIWQYIDMNPYKWTDDCYFE